MVFYFSGTGNSLYAARKLAAGNESVINIADAMSAGQTNYQIADGESVGFVFPVYFYTLNDVLTQFVEQLSL